MAARYIADEADKKASWPIGPKIRATPILALPSFLSPSVRARMARERGFASRRRFMLGYPTMSELRDAIYYQQLARVARLKADTTDDPYLARRLREAAIKHERMARKIGGQSVSKNGAE